MNTAAAAFGALIFALPFIWLLAAMLRFAERRPRRNHQGETE